jgi:hypothetical protein
MANPTMCVGEFYLVVKKKNGWMSRLAARLSLKAPAIKAGEVPVKLTIRVPETLFERPQLQATVTIPPECVTPPVLDAKVMDNVREVLQKQTGMDIRVSVVENGEAAE